MPVPSALRRGRGFWTLFALSAFACILGWFSLGGHLFEIDDPRDNNFARVGEQVGLVEAGTVPPESK